jgi:threonine dehydrogenase-like Zn-dependent dehydrogenase
VIPFNIQMAVRVAPHLGIGRVIGVDLVPERLAMAERHGAETIDAASETPGRRPPRPHGGSGTGQGCGRGRDGGPWRAPGGRHAAGRRRVARADEPAAGPRAGMDCLAALRTAIAAVRRGGTVSIVGVHRGAADPLPMLDLFDKGIGMRMGQAHVKRWVPQILSLLEREEDAFGLGDFVTHRLPLEDAPTA